MLRAIGDAQLPLLGFAERLLASRKPDPKPVRLPARVPSLEPTALPEIDDILTRLDQRKAAWSATPPKDRAKLLRSCLSTTLEDLLFLAVLGIAAVHRDYVYKEAAEVAVQAHGSYGSGLGEEMLAWGPIVGGLREYAESLEADGQKKPYSVTVRPDGQLVVDVFPLGTEALLFGQVRGEIWLLPGHAATQGAVYRRFQASGPQKGAVSLVLGAGNQISVAVLDILQKLVVDDSVVVCKMNPVNEYLGPFVRRALQPLVDEGYVELAYGGAKQGAYLCNHKLVADVHLTGSAATYNAIVWGGTPKPGPPPFPKPVYGELGCVTPYIIVPGKWSDEEMQYVVEMIITGKLQNCGHNCLAAEILVTDAAWPQRQQFLDCLQRVLDNMPQRAPYYPATPQKAAAFKAKFPSCRALGQPEGKAAEDYPLQPVLFVSHDDPSKCDTETENWGPVLQEVALPNTGGMASDFLKKAVAFANDECWGTLSISMFIDPVTQRENRSAFEQAVADLRYGSIVMNSPSLIAFGTTKLTWGAFPGSTPQDIGSGNCTVHNTLLLDHPQKSVLYVPWRYHPYPPWSIFHRNLENVIPPFMDILANPSMFNLVKAVPPCLIG